MNTRPVLFRISRNRRKAASAPSMRPKALSGSIAKYSRGLVLSALTLIGASQAPGADYYWDDDAATAGFGTAGASTGTWAAPTAGPTAGWSLSASGANAFAAFTTGIGDTLNFGNGATGLAAGTITVSGTVDAGNITFASGSGAIVLSGGTINLAPVSTITVNNASDTISSILAGAATSLTKAGTGTLTLSGANTYTGATNISNSGGTLQIGGAGQLGSGTYAGAISIGTSSTLRYSSSADQILSGTVTGAGLMKDTSGTSTLTLSGNSSNVPISLNAGTLALTFSTATPSFASPITTAAGTTLIFNPSVANFAGTAAATVNLNGTLTYNASGAFYQVWNGAVTANSDSVINITATGGAAGNSGLFFDGGLKGTAQVTVNNNTPGVGLVLRNPNNTLFSGTLIVNGNDSGVAATESGLAVSGATMPNANITVNGTLELGGAYATDTFTLSGIGWAAAKPTSHTFEMNALNGTGAVVGNMAITATRTLSVGNANGTGSFSGDIYNGTNDIMSFVKNGTGTQTLSGNNTYTGNTLVSAGTLQFAKQVSLYNNGAAVAWSKTNINVNSGATMAFNIGGSGEFTNANIVSLLGLADATTNGFKTGAILGLDTTSGDVLFSSVIANPNSGTNVLGLTKLGTNKLTLDQANTYSGSTTITGTLQIGGAGQLGSGTYAGTTTINASSTLLYSSSANQTLSGVVTGSGGLTKDTSATSTLTLSNTSTNYSGPTTLSAGTLALTFSTATPSFASPITTAAGTTLIFNPSVANGVTASTNVTLNGTLSYAATTASYEVLFGSVTANSTSIINISAVGGGAGNSGLYIDGGLKGTAQVTVNNNTPGVGLVLRNPSTTFSGTLIVNGNPTGVAATESGLAVSGATNLPNANITVNGTLELGGANFQNTFALSGIGWAAASSAAFTFTMNALNGTGAVVGNMATAGSTRTLSVGNANGTGSFSGDIYNGTNDIMSFVKNGTGTQTLSGNNTYTGNTLVSVGTLQFAKQVSLYNNGAAAAWSKTNINVNSGATMAFNIGGSGEFTNANIVSLLGLADATTNGFKTGAILGLDTTSGDVLFSSVIANPNSGTNVLGLTKLGTNKLTLDQANTYTGNTTVSNGTLKLNGAGVNTTILTDNNTATTSDIVINGGTLELAASEQIHDSGSINMTSGAFNFGAATGKIETIDKFTNSGGTFTTGANTLIGLGATVTWSGTSINTVSNGGLVQDGHIVISDTTSTNTVHGGATGGVLELLSTAPALLEMSNGATLTLNADAAFAGKLLLSGNISTIGDATVTIASAGVGNPGNIDLNNGTRTFTVADGAATTDMSISARITNTGSIIKDGAGTLSLDAANTYSGTTTINNGTLIANVLGALPLSPRSAVSFTGGGNPTLSLGANQVAASLNSVGVGTTGTVTLGSSNLTVGAASGTTDFKGSIGGAGNLIKDDASIQVISGTSNNTFTGTTTVSGGTLEVQGSLSGTTAVTVNTSGTLLLNSAASPIINTAATMTVGNSGTVKIHNSLSTTNQTFASLTLTDTPILDFGTGSSNAMTFSSLSFTATKLNVYNWSGSAYGAGVADGGNLTDGQDRLLFNANTIFTGTSDSRIEFFSDGGTTSLGFGQEVAFGSQFELVPITAVPEPATTALIGSIALCALIGYRERRRFTGLGKRTAARK